MTAQEKKLAPPQKEKKKTKKCLNSSCLVAFVVLRIFAVEPSAAAKRTVLKESSWPGRPEAIVPHSMDLSGFVLFSLVAAPLLSRWPTIQWIPPVRSTREGGTSPEFTSINTTGCVCSATNPSNNTQSCTQQPTCSPKRCFCPATDKFLSVSTPFLGDVFNKILSNHWKRWIPHQILEDLATLSAFFFLSRIKRQRTCQSSDRHFQANYHFPLFSDPKKKMPRYFQEESGWGGGVDEPPSAKVVDDVLLRNSLVWILFKQKRGKSLPMVWSIWWNDRCTFDLTKAPSTVIKVKCGSITSKTDSTSRLVTFVQFGRTLREWRFGMCGWWFYRLFTGCLLPVLACRSVTALHCPARPARPSLSNDRPRSAAAQETRTRWRTISDRLISRRTALLSSSAHSKQSTLLNGLWFKNLSLKKLN